MAQKENYITLKSMSLIIEHKDDDGNLVFRINKRTKKGKYHLVNADKQTEFVRGPINLEGFDRLPSGFYKEGYGLTTAGHMILQEVYKRYSKKIRLTVTSGDKGRIDARGKYVTMVLPQKRLANIGQSIRSIKRERNAEMRAEVQNFLGQHFTQFKDLKDADVGYVPGRLSEVLTTDKITKNLSPEDREALEEFIPEYLENIPGTLRSKKKLKVIYDALDAGKKIFLEKVLKEFRSKIKRKVQNEAIWQKFLSEYILVIQHNYSEVLEKESVSLEGKFPDFMLVDPYGYLDIYEIKKPSTRLMKLDTSRNNYYWDIEISKAIAQVENYIHQAQRHCDTLTNDIRRSKGLEVNIVRPRGYIVAGLRAQLTSAKMKDDFRILCESLKNVDIILYDDLLESLEAFGSRSEVESD